jgi:TonB-linked SusC/RagA family outer membrane protein
MTVPGVNVVVQGTTRGVQTDFNGNFSIKASAGEKLVFSFLGLKTQTVTVGTSNTISVQLEEDATLLENVVVEGYNITRTKAKSNVAVTTVSAATIEARPNASFIQTLQSQVAGLNIATGTGQPGGNSQVTLRGNGSINGKTEPLYVIDGVPLNSDNFRSLNPDEIASTSILKDAGATAKYGNRGANGVIIVTTKRGSFDSGLSIKYTSTTGFANQQSNDYNLMSSKQLLTLERDYGSGRGAGLVAGVQGDPMTDAEIAAAPNTNWNKYFFRTGVTQNQVLSLTSGGKNIAAFTSFGYFDQQGILLNTDLKRFTFRSNINGKSDNGKFNYATNISINFSRRHEATNLGTADINQNYVLGAIISAPYLSPDDYVDGAQVMNDYLASGSTLLVTPLMLVDKLKTFTLQTDEIKSVSSIEGSYKITKDLTFGSNFGLDYTQNTNSTNQGPLAFNSMLFQQADEAIGTEDHSFSRDVQFTTNTRLNYTKTFSEKHTLDITAYTEYSKRHFSGFNFRQNGLDPKVTSPGAGTGYVSDNESDDYNVPTVAASLYSGGLFSYFAIADYDYDGRFGFGATIRRDASSRFATSNRWGTFYSFTGRWNIDKEAFMQNTIFNSLKLRGSYGTNGNEDIGNGPYNELNRSRTLYAVGSGYGGATAYVLGQLENPDVKWETTTQADIGIDFEMFKNRFSGTIDVYDKKTSDLFLSLGISAITGYTNLSGNYGVMDNRGIEANFNYDLIKSNSDGLNVTLRFNGSYNKNRLLDIYDPSGIIDNTLTVESEGHVLDEYYLIKYLGVNPADGNLLFADKNGVPTENPDSAADRVYTGKSYTPTYQGGFGLDADYKGFFVSTQFSYVADVYRFDYDLSGVQDPTNIGIFNVSTDMLRAWTPDNRITDIPSLHYVNNAADSNSDRYLKDASYLRLRYASFGYQVPKKMLERTPFTNVKAFVQGENLVTWSKWRGWDAESPRGNDQNEYPTPRIVSVGLQLEF